MLAENDGDAGKRCEQAAVRLPTVTINISFIATVPAVFHFPYTVYSSLEDRGSGYVRNVGTYVRNYGLTSQKSNF